MGKKYDGYDEMMRAINDSRDKNITIFNGSGSSGQSRSFRENDEDVEMFMTSEDVVKERRKQEEIAERDGRPPRSLPPGEVEESTYFKRFMSQSDDLNSLAKRFTAEELAGFREGCARVIVHDFAEKDFYHLTDDERSRNDQLARLSMRLGTLKRIYRSVDQYVVAMRVVYEAWSQLATLSPLHTREEFFDYVSRGLIISNRIITPKLKGIDNFNQDLIFEYINNPNLDPSDLVPKPREDPEDIYYDDEDERRLELDRLLDEDELIHLTTYDQRRENGTLEGIRVQEIKSRYLKAYDDELNQRHRKKGKKKKVSKLEKRTRSNISVLLRRIQKNNYQREYYGSSSFGIMENFFRDTKRSSFYEEHPYDASWQNDETMRLYELAMEEERMNERLPTDNYLTYADFEMQNFYRTLENQGVSTVELRRRIGGDQEQYLEKRKKASRRENKKVERALLQRIEQLSNNPKFKKLVSKSEKALEEFKQERRDNDN